MNARGVLRHDVIFFNNPATAKGLARYSWTPTSSAFLTSFISVQLEIIRMGTLRLGELFIARSCLVNSVPDRPGMLLSSKIRSNFSFPSCLNPSTALTQASVFQIPSACKTLRSKDMANQLSSTTSTRKSANCRSVTGFVLADQTLRSDLTTCGAESVEICVTRPPGISM